MDDTATCPTLRDDDDDVARQWASGALSPAAEAEFETHLRMCTRCQRAVDRSGEVTAALRTAAASYDTVPPGPVQRFAKAVVAEVRAILGR